MSKSEDGQTKEQGIERSGKVPRVKAGKQSGQRQQRRIQRRKVSIDSSLVVDPPFPSQQVASRPDIVDGVPVQSGSVGMIPQQHQNHAQRRQRDQQQGVPVSSDVVHFHCNSRNFRFSMKLKTAFDPKNDAVVQLRHRFQFRHGL